MLLDIKPIRTPALRMKEDIYATFLNFIGKDYMLLLSSAWGFRLNTHNIKYTSEYVDLEEHTLERELYFPNGKCVILWVYLCVKYEMCEEKEGIL